MRAERLDSPALAFRAVAPAELRKVANLKEALALSRQLGDKRQLSRALNGLALLHDTEGELDKAGALYEESLALHREVGDRAGIASCLSNLAWMAICLGLGDRARH